MRPAIARVALTGTFLAALPCLATALPDRVRSLALLEPPLFGLVPAGPAFIASLDPVIATYKAGDRAGAIDSFMQVVGGAEYRATLMPTVGAAGFEQAVTDVFFKQRR